MKTLLLIISLFVTFSVFSQSTSMFVDSLRIYPVAPSPMDSIKFVAYSWHDTGSGFYDKKVVVSDSVIHIYSCWTWGPLMEEESVNDTVTLGPLNSGNYTIRYVLKFLRSWELDSVEPCLTNPYYDSTFLSFAVSTPSAINALEDKNMFSVFPNPASSKLFVSPRNQGSNSGDMSIFDISGRTVWVSKYEHMSTTHPFVINLESFQQGIYIVSVKCEEYTEQVKFVITR